jgi:predicted metal-dependent hydrolase
MTDNSRIVKIAGIGNVLLQPSARAKRIIISIRPDKGVRVAVPRRKSFATALEFVKAKKKWIKKHLAKVMFYEEEKKIYQDAFLSIDKATTKKRITGRLRELAQQYGFSYGKVSIRNQRTRWGSCSGNNNISLNIKLAALPPELYDYVILHELVHTRVHNHSRKFWRELDKYVGNGKAKAKSLVEYGLRIL